VCDNHAFPGAPICVQGASLHFTPFDRIFVTMALPRSWLAAVALIPDALAQQVQQFDLREACANLARFAGKEVAAETIQSQLNLTVGRVFLRDPKQRVMVSQRTGILLQGTAEDMELMTAMLAQLQRADLQELRVQCTLVTMPMAVATAAGLALDQPLAVEESQAGRILKDAVAAKGTLRNLPEAGLLPAQSAILGRPAAIARPDAAPVPFAELRVRVEALPTAEDEGWFALQLLDGEQRNDTVAPRKVAMADAKLRLKMGHGAMVMAARGEQATVLWVRFTGMRKAEPSKDAPADKRKEAPGDQGEPVRPGRWILPSQIRAPQRTDPR
jgi:hypothetical protein